MSMLLLLSVGCSNLPFREWEGGGSRYASGYASEEDTAGIDTGSTASAEGAPVLIGGSCGYVDGEVVGQVYIECKIAVNDSNDDVVGGRLYFTLLGDGETLLEDARLIVSEDANALTEALYTNENLAFRVGPVSEGVIHELVVYVNDFTVNSSNEETYQVTGA